MSAPLLVHPDAPAWFRRRLAVPFSDEVVDVDGCPIHYLAWGEVGRRGLVFVHGGGAHAHWWTHIAAAFADEYRVVAIDLSGHGDSGHRDVYRFEVWTDEVIAVAAAAGIDGLPVIVGHSMGGFVTIATAALHPEMVSGVVIVDSPVTEPDPEVEASRLKEAFGRSRTYPSVDEALQRFRTVPPQQHYLDYVMDHVGRRSLRDAEGGGVRWKFDPRCSPSSAARSAAWPCPTCAGSWPASPSSGARTASSPTTSATSCTRSWAASRRWSSCPRPATTRCSTSPWCSSPPSAPCSPTGTTPSPTADAEVVVGP
ncbi:MAG TPA: alpha/beta hydrolase [Iamia sp.]